MSCLNSIIKQQVSLLATFVAIQKSLHKQTIESTNRKAPYEYTTLADKVHRRSPSRQMPVGFVDASEY